MSELLGLLLALLLTLAAIGLVRLWRRLDRWRRGVFARPLSPGALRTASRLQTARAVARAQSDRIAALTAELARTRALLRRAERAAKQPPDDNRFQRAKRAFALRFHPDRISDATGLERSLRVTMFLEYWADLRRIERE